MASEFHSLWSAGMKYVCVCVLRVRACVRVCVLKSIYNAYSIHLTFVGACSCRTRNPLVTVGTTGCAQSSCAPEQELCCTVLEVGNSHSQNTARGICDPSLSVGVTSNTYCNRNKCTFTATSTTTYILLPSGTQEIFAHSV
jgi:hypothetical protein